MSLMWDRHKTADISKYILIPPKSPKTKCLEVVLITEKGKESNMYYFEIMRTIQAKLIKTKLNF